MDHTSSCGIVSARYATMEDCFFSPVPRWVPCQTPRPQNARWGPKTCAYRVGQDCIYIHTMYDGIFCDFPANNTVYTPYVIYNIWFWPALCAQHWSSMFRVGQNRIYYVLNMHHVRPYTMISLLKNTVSYRWSVKNTVHTQ